MSTYPKTIRIAATTTLLLCWLQPVGSRADSIYSRAGIGLQHYFTGAKSFGMGGAGIAMFSDRSLNYLNPAALPYLRVTRFDGNLLYESNNIKQPNQENSFGNTIFQGVQITLPVKAGHTIGFGILPVSQVSYRIESNQTTSDFVATGSLTGSGGLAKLFMNYGGRLNDWLAVGAGFNFYFGRIENTTRVVFSTSGYDPTRNIHSAYMRGVGGQFGLALQPSDKIAAGAIFRFESKLNLDLQDEFIFGKRSDIIKGKLEMPFTQGYGFAFRPSPSVRLMGDVLFENWGSVPAQNILGAQTVNTFTGAGGIELIPTQRNNAGLFRTFYYRVGFRTAKLPYRDENGREVSENVLTFGLTVPFLADRSKFDIGFEIGQRGSLGKNPAEEKIFRMVLGVTSGEIWFQRPR